MIKCFQQSIAKSDVRVFRSDFFQVLIHTFMKLTINFSLWWKQCSLVASFFFFMSAGIYNRLSIKSDANRVYGWSSHNCITPTAKRSAWDDNPFLKAYECSPCSLLCFPTHQRGFSSSSFS